MKRLVSEMLTFMTKQMIVRGFTKYLIIQVALNLLKFTQSFMGKKGSIVHPNLQTS